MRQINMFVTKILILILYYYMLLCWCHAYLYESIDVVTKIKSFLTSNFDMKDMGEAFVILGIKVL